MERSPMTNEELEFAVAVELFWNPKVDSAAIAVSADSGTVTLRGVVGSPLGKREAHRTAERVYGVVLLNNDLDVRIFDGARHEDSTPATR
jgi:osmotically-inducible protein OsmY